MTAKFRIFPDRARTVAYAKMMEAAGAQIITCHGRTREMKGQAAGLADWEMIREVKNAVKIPVFANGNILYAEDVDRCLEVTGCDGVMTAEVCPSFNESLGLLCQGNLSNPAIFVPPDHPHAHLPMVALGNRYLDIVESLETPTAGSAIKGHLFRLFKSVLNTDDALRIMISKAHVHPEHRYKMYRDVLSEIEKRLQVRANLAVRGFTLSYISARSGCGRTVMASSSHRCCNWISDTSHVRRTALYPLYCSVRKGGRRKYRTDN